MDTESEIENSIRDDHWLRTKRLTLQLLSVWLAATFCIIFFARELNEFSFFGWPLSYYLAAQGAILLYTAIVGIYALKMRSLDRISKSHKADRDVE